MRGLRRRFGLPPRIGARLTTPVCDVSIHSLLRFASLTRHTTLRESLSYLANADGELHRAEAAAVVDAASLLVDATGANAPGVPIAVLSRGVRDDALDTLGDEDVSLRDVLDAHAGLFATEKDPASGKVLARPAAAAVSVAGAVLAAAGVLRPVGTGASPEEAEANGCTRVALVWAFVLCDLAAKSAGANVVAKGGDVWAAEQILNRAVKRANRALQGLMAQRMATQLPALASAVEMVGSKGPEHVVHNAVADLAQRTRMEGAVACATADDGAATLREQCWSACVARVQRKPQPMLERFVFGDKAQVTLASTPAPMPTITPPTLSGAAATGAFGESTSDADAVAAAATANRLRTAVLLAALPTELVCVNAETRATVCAHLQSLADRCARVNERLSESVRELVAALETVSLGDADAFVAALQESSDGVLVDALDVVRLPATWLPRTPAPAPPTDHIWAGPAEPAAPIHDGDQSNVEALADAASPPEDAAAFDDTCTVARKGRERLSPEAAWLNAAAAPQKVLIEPFSLFSIGSQSQSALRAWAGSVTKAAIPADVLAANSDAEDLIEMDESTPRVFFRLLPPFHATRRELVDQYADVLSQQLEASDPASPLPADDEEAEAATRSSRAEQVLAESDGLWDGHAAREYDVLRLARTLSACEGTSLVELVRRGVCSILGCADLQLLLLSRPTMFDFTLPPPASDDPVAARAGGVAKFNVAQEHRCRLKPALPEELQHTMATLREERRHAPKHKKYRLTRRIIDAKNRLVHAEHPGPHPLMDPDVLALFVFDVLPAEGPVEVDTLYSIMPRAARLGPTQVSAFYRRFPHLFHIFEMGQDPVKVFVQRADAPRPSEVDPDQLSADELMAAVVAPFRFAYRDDRPTQLGFVTGRLVRSYRTAIDRRYGSVQGFVEAHPQVFEMRPDEQYMGVTARLRPTAAAQMRFTDGA